MTISTIFCQENVSNRHNKLIEQTEHYWHAGCRKVHKNSCPSTECLFHSLKCISNVFSENLAVRPIGLISADYVKNPPRISSFNFVTCTRLASWTANAIDGIYNKSVFAQTVINSGKLIHFLPRKPMLQKKQTCHQSGMFAMLWTVVYDTCQFCQCLGPWHKWYGLPDHLYSSVSSKYPFSG